MNGSTKVEVRNRPPLIAPRELIYLDHNATTPVLPEVIAAMTAAMAPEVANPSSLHAAGRAGRKLLEGCRERIARRLAARPAECVLTSGGTEANQLAVLAALEGGGAGGAGTTVPPPPEAVISQIEHPSTLDVVRSLERAGRLAVRWVAADRDGLVSAEAIAACLTERTRLVSLLHANNETGAIQDVAAVGALCRGRGVPFHCDAVQSLGKVPLRVEELRADLVTFSSHKVYGPKGLGLLWVRDGFPFRHPFGGGPQERGRRPGTENVPAVAGFAAALDALALAEPGPRDRFLERVLAGCRGAVLNGRLDRLVPNTANVSFPGVPSELLLIRLDLAGVCASSGSACASGAREPSHVLRSMGVGEERVSSAVRFSFGRDLPRTVVDRAADIVIAAVRALSR